MHAGRYDGSTGDRLSRQHLATPLCVCFNQRRHNADLRQMVTPLHRFRNANALGNSTGSNNMYNCRVTAPILRPNNENENNCPRDSTQRRQLYNTTNNVTTAGNNQLILSNDTSNETHRSILDYPEVNRLRCGVWITFVLATGFVAAAEFYFGHRDQGIEIFVFWVLLTLSLFAGFYSILCRRRQRNSSQEHRIEEEHIAPVTATTTMPSENIRSISIIRQNPLLPPPPPPPPPYHIAILIPPHNMSDEAPPPSYDKIMR